MAIHQIEKSTFINAVANVLRKYALNSLATEVNCIDSHRGHLIRL